MELYEYNPALLKPEELKEMLVGRDKELGDVGGILKNAASGGSFSNAIFVGPRGIGKTHLLQVINLAVKGVIEIAGITDTGKNFIPVIFPEEEYASDIAQFVKLILQYLPVENRYGVLDEISKSPLIGEREKTLAVTFLETFKSKTGKILLLLIDNLNDIIDSFPDEDKSLLRSVLIASESVLVIGAAPTVFKSIINHDEPLYNFFEIKWLRELSFPNATELLNNCARLNGRQDYIALIAKSGVKLKTIYTLVGGTPRLIMTLYHIIAEGDVISVEKMLLVLLNKLTPYFHARMKDLSEQQRRIIDAMVREKTLLTPTEMARCCQLPVGTVNVLLKRLEEAGYINKKSRLKGNRVLYDVNEKLFALWRQMRVEAGRERLGFIVRFLEIWYSEDELLLHLDKILFQIHDATFKEGIDKLWYFKEAHGKFRGNDEICVACKRGDYDAALELLVGKVAGASGDSRAEIKISCLCEEKKVDSDKVTGFLEKAAGRVPGSFFVWVRLADALLESGHWDGVIDACINAKKVCPNEKMKWLLLMLFYLEGSKGNTGNSIKMLKELLSSFITEPADMQEKSLDGLFYCLKGLIVVKNFELLKITIDEIEKTGIKKLIDLLHPYITLLQYLENKDIEILARLRYEERIIIDEMLKLIEKGPTEPNAFKTLNKKELALVKQ
jgi:DNA-binding MarR family transcriptional regulator